MLRRDASLSALPDQTEHQRKSRGTTTQYVVASRAGGTEGRGDVAARTQALVHCPTKRSIKGKAEALLRNT